MGLRSKKYTRTRHDPRNVGYKYCEDKIEDKEVEPNSSLGKAMKYMKNHKDGMSQFLKVPGLPLDNGRSERQIKLAVVNRKNSYFYKTSSGSLIGDICMSLIETSKNAKINVFEYFKQIGLHAQDVKDHAEQWFPWNYHLRMKELHPT